MPPFFLVDMDAVTSIIRTGRVAGCHTVPGGLNMKRRDFCRDLAWAGAGLAAATGCSSKHQADSEKGAGKAAEGQTGETYLYILRLAMVPDFHEEERLAALSSFCREARIDDVAFILWAEELNTGHPTLQEIEPWLRMVERVKPRLAAQGVTTSLNPWSALLHADRGRVLKPGQQFRLMVDSNGRTASATACPLCPALREHLRQQYERLAQLQPRVIWVDDDFRLHNHSPLQWGGCFCELHMREFSRRAGRTVTREEFVKGVLQPGAPHPYRRVWLDTNRDTMVSLAAMLGQAVNRVSPKTQVGLMSSAPEVHCIEGRDWEGVLRALAAGKAPVNRPHLPSYSEVSGADYLWNFSRISRLSAAMVPPDTLLYPELENWPHSRFSKSRTFTRFQIESSAALGTAGITMDIFDLFGNGAMPQEGYAQPLAQAKALAKRLRDLKLEHRKETGVQVLYNPKASYSLWTEKGQSLSELAPEEDFWAGFLGVMGIANTFREWSGQNQCVLAVSGQYCRGLQDAQVRELLSGNVVLLSGDAIFTLVQMGLGSIIGVKRADWLASDSGMPSYEQVTDGRTYAGLREGRLTAQALTGDYLNIEYAGDVSVHTEVRNPSGERTGPGMAVVGKRLILLPYGRSTGYLGLRHPVRQALVQSLLSDLAGERCPVFLESAANIAIYAYDLGERRALLLANASNDDYDELRLGGVGWSPGNAVEISSEGTRALGNNLQPEGNRLVLKSGLRRFEVKALVFS
jgi:hypothetical protein